MIVSRDIKRDNTIARNGLSISYLFIGLSRDILLNTLSLYALLSSYYYLPEVVINCSVSRLNIVLYDNCIIDDTICRIVRHDVTLS